MPRNYLTMVLWALVLSTFCLDANPAEAQSFVWAKRLGGPNSDWAQSIAIGSNGDIYTTGSFSETADFDPGPGVFNLTAAGPTDIFISKLDNDGNFLWAVRFGGDQDDTGFGVAVDPSGNVYVGGSSTNQGGDKDIIVARDSTAGAAVWARRMGGSRQDEAFGIAVDQDGNVYTTGKFGNGGCDFDPGPAEFILPGGGDELLENMFISKLDGDGAFVWAKQITPGYFGPVIGLGIATSVDGVNITESFYHLADFDPGPEKHYIGEPRWEHSANSGAFIMQLDHGGNYVWANNVKNVGRPLPWGDPATSEETSRAVFLGAEGQVYIAGDQNRPRAPGQGFVQANGSWKDRFGGPYEDRAFGVTADASGNVYTVGYSVAEAGDANLLLTKHSNSGDKIWIRRIGGIESVLGLGITIDPDSNLYVTGGFFGSVDFKRGRGRSILTAAGSSADVSVLKLAQ